MSAPQQQSNMMTDILKTQLMMQVVGTARNTSPVRSMILLNIYERIALSFPVWFPKLKAFCSRRSKQTPSTPQPPPNRLRERLQSPCTRLAGLHVQSRKPPWWPLW